MGVAPDVWGPILWGAIHITCLAGTATPEFINAFSDALPCPACASHFKELLMEFPFPASDDPIVLFEWSVNAHNRVNARIGKPILTMEQALSRWAAKDADAQPPPQFDFKIPIVLILLIILIFMFVKNK
jgi:hypothetical protein